MKLIMLLLTNNQCIFSMCAFYITSYECVVSHHITGTFLCVSVWSHLTLHIDLDWLKLCQCLISVPQHCYNLSYPFNQVRVIERLSTLLLELWPAGIRGKGRMKDILHLFKSNNILTFLIYESYEWTTLLKKFKKMARCSKAYQQAIL